MYQPVAVLVQLAAATYNQIFPFVPRRNPHVSDCPADPFHSLVIGAVSYLNARPLTYRLAQRAARARIVVDVPSRLADGLTDGRFDVALIPSIEYLRCPGATIVSDACVASHGPVMSVKLLSRVPIDRIGRLALDEGSRTSVAMIRILLKERFGLQPELEQLPIGASPDDSTADAVLLIGDRAMTVGEGAFPVVWDLGQEWTDWTRTPFVFALWVARSDAPLDELARLFADVRDDGLRHLDDIARAEAGSLGISVQRCRAYLRDHLRFRLGPKERQGLETFFQLAGRHGLAPRGVELAFVD